MSIRNTLSALALGALVTVGAHAASTRTALAQTAPGPITPAQPAITMEEARRIAIDNGMARIEEIELEDGLWELDGRDNAGAEIGIDIRASDGTIVKIERDRPASAEVRP